MLQEMTYNDMIFEDMKLRSMTYHLWHEISENEA